MSRSRRIAIACLAVLTLGGLAAFGLIKTRLSQTADARSALAIGGPFNLTAVDGSSVSDKNFRGKWLLVYFGYTYCPDVCPTTLNEIATTLDKLGPLATKVEPLFITVDPQRDTPEVMGKYVESFGSRIVGLTGTPAEIAAVAREYRVYYAKAQTGTSPNDYLMNHTSLIYVMNPDGRYVTIFASQIKPEGMTLRLRQLLNQAS